MKDLSSWTSELFGSDETKKPSKSSKKLNIKFRVFVKKALAWRFKTKQKESEGDSKVKEYLGEENKQEDFSAMIRKIGLENLNELIKKNKKRVKILIHQQHENFLISKLETMLQQQVNITDLMSIRTDIDNVDFYNEQSQFDRKLILLLANQDFIDTLDLNLQAQSKALKDAFRGEEKKKKQNGEEESEDEEDVDDVESSSMSSSESRTDGNEEEEEFEEVEGEWSSTGGQSDGEETKEAENKQLEEIKVNAEEALENDSEYEDVSDFSDEEAGHPKPVQEEEKETIPKIIDDLVAKDDDNIGRENKNKKKKVSGGNKDEHQDQSVSSSCHTEEGSDIWDEGLNNLSNESENDFYVEDEDNGSETSRYDELVEVDDTCEEDFEFTEYKRFTNIAQKVEKTLKDVNFLPKSQDSIEKRDENLYAVNDWVEKVLFLFISNNKNSKLILPLGKFYQASSYSLFYSFLMLTSLDPLREATIISLLTLYLNGQELKLPQNLGTKTLSKDEIINFLHQYALRCPSAFFRRIIPINYQTYLSSFAKMESTDATALDLLLKYYLIYLEQDKMDQNDKTMLLLRRLITLLLNLRTKAKGEEVSEYISNLRQRLIDPLREDIINSLLKIAQRRSSILEGSEANYLFTWLQCLVHFPPYRKTILITCEKLLEQLILKERTILNTLNAKAEEVLTKSTEPTIAEKQYFTIFLAEKTLQTPKILNILSFILNSAVEEDPTLKAFITESNILKIGVKDLSMVFMKTLETITKLKEKHFLEELPNLQATLKDIVEMPVHYYLYLSKLKEFNIDFMKGDNQCIENPPDLMKIPSDKDAPPLLLERAYSASKYESFNFQELLPHWLKKNRGFINGIFKVSNKGEDNVNLWIVKRFPWILDFDVKDKMLRDVFSSRAQEEEEGQNDDEEFEIKLFIRRRHILEDTISEFQKHSHDRPFYNFCIEFVNEPGVDQGGLKKEWLNLLSKEIFEPNAGLFKLSANLRTLHPTSLSIFQPGVMTYFKLAGTLAGLVTSIAIKEKIPIDVNFSKSFLKIIMDIQPDLKDLEDIEPELMGSLKWMRSNDVTGLEQPFIYELNTFGVNVTQELIEKGNDTSVDENNKELYVKKLYLAKTLSEVEAQTKSFKKGFFEIVPENAIKLFSSRELGILIAGKSEIDIQDLKAHALYREISKESLLVQWFWEMVEIMDQNMLANLLFFVTGSSKVPHGGFKDSPIILVKGNNDTSSLPVAHTCFSELELPLYESKEQFYEKLLLAISEGKEGFYIA